ncbi:glycosyltransferase [Pseudomonas sp. NPDC007930]|uniref:glycosyltransferase family 2 protein n=1 Tax=Pseudomonas sp. NPDC007930 TaxID=3364417 RepID=UPI0036E5B213
MPCYNNGRFIEAALDAVFAQDYQPIEVIVVNDGSTDDSLATLQALQARLPFKLLSQPNAGVSAALNLGLAHASGEYVVTPDSDDEMLPGALTARAAYMDAHPDVGIVGGLAVFTNAEGQPYKQERHTAVRHFSFETLLGRALAVGTPVAMYRMSALKAVGFYDPAIRIQDFQITLRLAHAGYGVVCLPVLVSTYRRHPGSLSRRYREQLKHDLAAIAPYQAHPRYTAARTVVYNKALKHAVQLDRRESWGLFREVPLWQWNRMTWRRFKRWVFRAPRVGKAG